MILTPTSRLEPADQAWILKFLRDFPSFQLFFHCGVRDLEKGLDNRSYAIGQDHRGLLMCRHSHNVQVYSAVGTLTDAELATVLDFPGTIELHLTARDRLRLLPIAAGRLKRTDGIRFYRLVDPPQGLLDRRCRPVTPQERSDVRSFFRQNMPEAVPSDWMFDLPLVGVWDGSLLVATAGTLLLHERLHSAHIGNLLADRIRRRRGFAKIALIGLIELLRQQGITTLTLDVFDSNDPACRTFESLGFEIVDRRSVLYLDPTGTRGSGKL